jgi:hypothetical protein
MNVPMFAVWSFLMTLRAIFWKQFLGRLHLTVILNSNYSQRQMASDESEENFSDKVTPTQKRLHTRKISCKKGSTIMRKLYGKNGR